MFLYLLFLLKDKIGMMIVWNYSYYIIDYIVIFKKKFFLLCFLILIKGYSYRNESNKLI